MKTIAVPLSVAGTLLGALSLSAFLLPGAAQAGGGVSNVTSSTIKIDGVRYWRKKANEAFLGGVGEKKAPAVGSNYFQLVQPAPKGIYKVHTGSPVTIAKNTTHDWNVTAGRSNVTVGAGSNGDKAKNYTLYKMRIDLGNRKGDLRFETNRAIKQLNALKAEGNTGRMISAVWILIEGSESSASCYSGDLDVNAAGWTIDTTAQGCRETSYAVSPGSIVAYEMVKVDEWEKAELTDKPTCPAGTQYEIRSSALHPQDRCVKTKVSDRGVRCKLAVTDDRSNWYVKERAGRDTCKSRKGKPDKDVECVHGSDKYVAQSGKDKCEETTETYSDPSCPAGYDYDARTGNDKDVCKLEGIESFDVDANAGF